MEENTLANEKQKTQSICCKPQETGPGPFPNKESHVLICYFGKEIIQNEAAMRKMQVTGLSLRESVTKTPSSLERWVFNSSLQQTAQIITFFESSTSGTVARYNVLESDQSRKTELAGGVRCSSYEE